MPPVPADCVYEVPVQVSKVLLSVFHLVSPNSGAGHLLALSPNGITKPPVPVTFSYPNPVGVKFNPVLGVHVIVCPLWVQFGDL